MNTYSPINKIVERLIFLQVLDPLDDSTHDKVGCTQAADLDVLHRQGLNLGRKSTILNGDKLIFFVATDHVYLDLRE